MKMTTLTIILTLSLFACKKENVVEQPSPKFETKTIAQSELYGNGNEGIVKQNLVISNDEDWANIMAQMDSVNDVSSSFSETDVDFTKYQIVASFDEVKSSGGHSLVLDIEEKTSTIEITVTHVMGDGITTSVMNQPFNLIKVSKDSREVVFK
ncbi:MAG: hypothetical protein ACJAZ3_000943 [Sphingobacteriales bacterium]|jgi:hypothetical protein